MGHAKLIIFELAFVSIWAKLDNLDARNHICTVHEQNPAPLGMDKTEQKPRKIIVYKAITCTQMIIKMHLYIRIYIYNIYIYIYMYGTVPVFPPTPMVMVGPHPPYVYIIQYIYIYSITIITH